MRAKTDTHVKRGKLGQAAQGVPILALQPVRTRVFVRVVEPSTPSQEEQPLSL